MRAVVYPPWIYLQFLVGWECVSTILRGSDSIRSSKRKPGDFKRLEIRPGIQIGNESQ